MASFTTLPGQNLPPGFTNVSASSLAGLAGVIPSAFDGIGSETKHQLALVQLGMLQSMPEHAADIIYSELAAKHLPGLAERFIAETKLMNAPMIVMNSVTHTPYFVRFLTTPAGQDLASIQTKRIAECSDADARGQPQERVGEACQFAATLLVLQGHASVPTETKTAAISRLEQWKRQHRRTFAEEAADRCLGGLRSPGNFGSEMGFMIVGFKMMLRQPLRACGGGRGCRRTVDDGQGEMSRCSRCRTTLYCGAECQKAAWRTHKTLCFVPGF